MDRRIFWILIVVLICMSGIVRSADVAGAQGKTLQWSLPFNVSNTPGLSRFVRITSDMEGTLHAVWSENVETDPNAWGNSIYYAQFKQGRWSTAIDLVYTGKGVAHLPAVAADEKGNLHLIWTDQNRIYYQQARVDKATTVAGWSSPKTISWGGQERAYWSDIVVASDTIHVAWSGSLTGLWDIYYARSTDSGRTWTNPVQVTDTPSIAETRPRLAIDRNNTVHLMWGQNKDNDDPVGSLMYSRSTDGTHWELPVSGSEFKGFSDLVALAVDSKNRLHQVWQQGSEWHSAVSDPNHGLYHRWSEDGGKTWTKPTRIARGWSYLSLAVDSVLHLHLVWGESPVGVGGLGNQNVFYASWDGTRWSTPVQLASDEGDTRPQIAVTDGNKLNVVWAKNKPDEVYDILHISATTDALPFPPRVFPTVTPTLQPTATFTPTLAHSPTPALTRQATSSFSETEPVDTSQSAWISLAVGILPILLLVVAVVGIRMVRIR